MAKNKAHAKHVKLSDEVRLSGQKQKLLEEKHTPAPHVMTCDDDVCKIFFVTR